MLDSLRSFFRSTFGLTVTGCGFLWAALPPLDLAPLAWIAPVFWALLIRVEKLPSLRSVGGTPLRGHRRAALVYEGRVASESHALRKLRDVPLRRSLLQTPGFLLLIAAILLFAADMVVTAWFHDRKFASYWAADTVFWLLLFALVLCIARHWAERPYRSLWLAYMFFWLAALHWLRLPYWAIGFGWLALGIYFGLYMPVFIGVSRFAVHRLRLPLIVVAPTVFTGLELAQAHLLSGMTMGCLEHTQYRWTQLIQISDMTGCYGVTFLMVFVAACAARMLPCDGKRWSLWPVVPGGVLLAGVLVYGHYRAGYVATEPGLKIALIQGNLDVQLLSPPDIDKKVYEEHKRMHDDYHRLTRDALRDFPQADLVVWPETVFCWYSPEIHDYGAWVTGADDAVVPANFPLSPDEFPAWLDDWRRGTPRLMTETAVEFQRPMIVGVVRDDYGRRGRKEFNSAALITPDGRWHERPPDEFFYDKTHLVPFGEYMPFANLVPWLQELSPLGSGTAHGGRTACFTVKGIRLVPSICYETTLAHVIRGQLAELAERGCDGQILVNVTNDGWFWGSSELEQHLACGVYRAVECRRPLVIAANTGISAAIDGNGHIQPDGNGHIQAEGPRRGEATLFADVRLDNRASWYVRHGDLFGSTCLAATVALAVAGLFLARRRTR